MRQIIGVLAVLGMIPLSFVAAGCLLSPLFGEQALGGATSILLSLTEYGLSFADPQPQAILTILCVVLWGLSGPVLAITLAL